MARTAKPDLIILGQVTIDDVVPAKPAPWRRQIGGSSLYALAGARLWLDPGRLGLVARLGLDYPFDLEPMLAEAGVEHVSLSRFGADHLVEWLIYEADGSRRSLPRNRDLLDIGGEGAIRSRSYQDKLLEIAPTAAEIPPAWLPVAAVHLCPQVGQRHAEAVKALRPVVDWISVDPSPHYSRDADIPALIERLFGVDAFLPSEQEIETLLQAPAAEVVRDLHGAGFSEVALKRGARPALLAHDGVVGEVSAVEVTVIDPTGAGDSFCGAYAACRLIGLSPKTAAERAMTTAALVVGCSGVEAALSLTPADL